MVLIGGAGLSSKDSFRSVLKFLRLLSRKGAFACEADGVCSGGAEIAVLSEDGTDQVGEVARHTFSLAYSKGFLAKDADEPCWRISAHGITFLKRSMSRGDVSVGCAQDGTGASGVSSNRGGARGFSDDSPLAWLRARKDREGHALITQQQFDAGERLRADFYAGNLNERVTMNWSGFHVRAGQGSGFRDRELSLSETATAARERVRRAMRDVGPELSGVLVDVCCFGKKLTVFEREHSYPQRAGKVVLCLGLSALARHYGIGRASRRGARAGQ